MIACHSPLLSRPCPSTYFPFIYLSPSLRFRSSSCPRGARAVLLKIYAYCIDGQGDAANQRITDALGVQTPGPNPNPVMREMRTVSRHPECQVKGKKPGGRSAEPFPLAGRGFSAPSVARLRISGSRRRRGTDRRNR
jgi:hypothetical protein